MNDSISAAPIAQALMPYAVSISAALITAFVGWLASRVQAWTHSQMSQADQATLSKAVNDAAGVIFAEAEAGISTQSIHVGDPRVVAQAARIGAFLPVIVQSLGLTPDNLAHMVAGALGRLQAQSIVTPAPAAPATPAKAS